MYQTFQCDRKNEKYLDLLNTIDKFLSKIYSDWFLWLFTTKETSIAILNLLIYL